MQALYKFFRTPLNQGALVAIGGSIWAVLNGSTHWWVVAPVLAGAVVAWILPDNSVAKEDVEQIVADAIKAGQDIAKAPKQ